MRTRPPLTRDQRARRKQDLLLASTLARNQALVAIGQIGQRADVLVGGYRQLRTWMALPQVSAAAGALSSMVALMALRRLRSFRLLRWGWMGWRTWKLATGLLPGLLPGLLSSLRAMR
jgi:hypothetical protein